MIIRKKLDSLYQLKKLGLNFFPEEIFNPRDKNMLEKVSQFLSQNDADLYVIRDISKWQGKIFFNMSKEETLKNVLSYDDNFSIAVSSRNYGKYVLIGDIYISDTLDKFWIFASDNPNYNTREVLRDPRWNYSTDYYDRRLKYIPNIDKIIDYIFVHSLFNVIVEFAVYPRRAGKNNEFVAIFELRTDY